MASPVDIQPPATSRCPPAQAHPVSSKIGCTAQMLCQWPNKAERDSRRKPGLATEAAARLKAPERENRELHPANEILRKGIHLTDCSKSHANEHSIRAYPAILFE